MRSAENHSGLMEVLQRRPRKRSCDSMTDSSSCARSSPARPRLGLFVRSLSFGAPPLSRLSE